MWLNVPYIEINDNFALVKENPSESDVCKNG